MLAAVTAIVLPAVTTLPVRLLWNASASVPVGLYAVQALGTPQIDELVIVAPPEPLADFLAARGALPRNVLLVKPVAALPGQTICRHDRGITIDGIARGDALAHDRLGRPLPAWDGCRIVGPAEIFLMNPARPDSLDGRYFGTLPMKALRGRATPLWIPKEP
jgi:conjugative transfer signal peptidase TraF